MTRLFFATVQNRMHCAVHGHTAAEILYTRANAKKEHMGLRNWEDAPNGKIKKSDVVIAKNYLDDNERAILERMVNAFHDYAETQTMKKIPYLPSCRGTSIRDLIHRLHRAYRCREALRHVPAPPRTARFGMHRSI